MTHALMLLGHRVSERKRAREREKRDRITQNIEFCYALHIRWCSSHSHFFLFLLFISFAHSSCQQMLHFSASLLGLLLLNESGCRFSFAITYSMHVYVFRCFVAICCIDPYLWNKCCASQEANKLRCYFCLQNFTRPTLTGEREKRKNTAPYTPWNGKSISKFTRSNKSHVWSQNKPV